MSSLHRLVSPLLAAIAIAVPAAAGQVQIQMTQQVVGEGPQLPIGRQVRSGTGRIKGRVISAETGSPVRRAAVRLGGADAAPGTVITDGEGRYEFMNLPDGRFTVSASKAGYVDMQYGQSRPFEGGKPIQLAEGQVVDKADITLPRGGVITGRVVDEFGEPIADAQVMAQRMRWSSGRRSLMNAGRFAQTNDLGQYRLYGLPPGDYYVTATSRGEGMMEDMVVASLASARGGPAPAPTTTPPTSGFVPTYFPGTPSAGEAQKLTVAVGQDTSGIDFALVAARYARITGVVINSEGRPVEGAMVTPVPRSTDGMIMLMGGGARTTREGTFTLSKVSPGDYTLTIRSVMMMTSGGGGDTFMFTTRVGGPGDGGGEFASVPLSVSGEDISNLVITTSKGATLNGRVSFEGERPASANNIRITSVPLDGEGPMMAAGLGTTVKADGTFQLQGMSGARALRVSGLPNGWTLKSVTSNGIDVTDSGIEFKGSDTVSGVEVVLSSRATDVSGGVSDGRGSPVTDYTVVIFSEDSQKWSVPATRWITGTRPDQDGRFHVRAMPAGSYYAAALEYVAQGEWNDPDLLERVKSQATRFTLGEGETRTLDLKIVSGG